jgi:kynurenine formamidase
MRHAISRRGLVAAAAAFAATAVAPSMGVAAPRPFRRTVDLTHTMSADFPTFDGAPGIDMRKIKDLKKDGYNLYQWQLIEHSGTHLDAPIHFSETGATVEQIPADTLVVPLAVINVADKAAKDPDYQLSRSERAGAPAWTVADQCCIAMNSGWAPCWR